jgi:hypothetical protein
MSIEIDSPAMCKYMHAYGSISNKFTEYMCIETASVKKRVLLRKRF